MRSVDAFLYLELECCIDDNWTACITLTCLKVHLLRMLQPWSQLTSHFCCKGSEIFNHLPWGSTGGVNYTSLHETVPVPVHDIVQGRKCRHVRGERYGGYILSGGAGWKVSFTSRVPWGYVGWGWIWPRQSTGGRLVQLEYSKRQDRRFGGNRV